MPNLRSTLILALMPALAGQAPALKSPILGKDTAITRLDDPRALMLKARSMQIRSGGDDPKGAVAIYRQVITMMPKSAEAHLRLSEALEESKDDAGAIQAAKRAVALDPRSGEALGQVASLLFNKAREDKATIPEAKQALIAATNRLPGDPQMWAFLAQVSEADSDDRTALGAWLHLGRLRPDFIPAWERAVIHAWVLKDYSGRREAIMALCDREEPRPNDLKQLGDLAQEQMKSGFLGHAEDSYRLLAEHMPEEPAVWENLALVELRIPEFASALANLQKAERIKPNPSISFNISLCLMNLDRFDEASARIEQLMKDLPASDLLEKEKIQDLCQTIYGQSLLLRSQPKALLTWMKKTPIRPGSAGELAIMRAQALIETGDFTEAKAAILDGEKQYPNLPFFKSVGVLPRSRTEWHSRLRKLDMQTLAEMWAGFGQWQTCLDTLIKAKALGGKDNADMLILESNAYDQLNRPEDVLLALRAAQKLAPTNPTLQNNLGYLLLDHYGDLKEAATLIESALKQDPDNGSFIDSLGWLRFKQGNFQDAETQLRRASELRPYSADVRLHLGEVLLKLHKPDEAITQWERALAFAFPGRNALEKRLNTLRAQQAREISGALHDSGDGDGGDGE